METMKVTREDVKRLVAESGFPFELKAAKHLADLGFIVHPSYQFYDASRGKDTELDVVAFLNQKWKTKSGKTLQGILEVAIECKDNSLPYVCLGLPRPPDPAPGILDGDSGYCQIATSRDDGLANKFALVLFDSEHGGKDVKLRHHYFVGDTRFYFLAGVEMKGSRGKEFLQLHTPETISYAKTKLGAFVGNFHGYGANRPPFLTRSVEEIGLEKGPMILVCFTVLLHSGVHYRCTPENPEPIETMHTPVFLGRTYLGTNLNYVVDLVQYRGFGEAVGRITNSFHCIVEHLILL